MLTSLLLASALTWAAAGVAVDESTGVNMVADAVTVEGTVSLDVYADTCRMEFVTGTRGDTATEALANLKPTRTVFTSAVKGITGVRAKIEFSRATVARQAGQKQVPEWFEAAETATVEITDFPREREELSAYLGKISAAAAESRAVRVGEAVPKVTFELTRPQVFEKRLLKAAVEDAGKRAELAGKALGRNVLFIKAADIPAGVLVKGEFKAFSESGEPVTSDEQVVKLVYTVRVAYALEAQ